MKASKTVLDSIFDMKEVKTSGDLRRIVANSMLALVRKEISSADVMTLAKGLDSVAHAMDSEVKVIRAHMDMREKGTEIVKLTHMGQMLIGNESGGA